METEIGKTESFFYSLLFDAANFNIAAPRLHFINDVSASISN